METTPTSGPPRTWRSRAGTRTTSAACSNQTATRTRIKLSRIHDRFGSRLIRVYLDGREVLLIEFHGVSPHGTVERLAAADTRLGEAALDAPPRLRRGDPRLQPAGVVPEAVLPVPAPVGSGASTSDDHEREHGEGEDGDDEQEHENHVRPEERPGGAAAAAGAGEADKGEQKQRETEGDDGELQGALALCGGAHVEVDARAQHRQGQEERHHVQSAQEAVAQPRHW